MVRIGVVVFAAAMAVVGCSSKPQVVQPSQQGDRGESCQARNDCRQGLACLKNTCEENDFPISVKTKQCDLVECQTKADCCADFSVLAVCSSLKSQCDTGDAASCSQYALECECQKDCQDNRCLTVRACSTDIDCVGLFCGRHAATDATGICVDCRTSADCGAPLECVSGSCKPGCTKNDDCPLLQTCEGGRCTPTGCQSDRECYGFTGSPLAKCVATKCQVPCVHDGECDRFEVCRSGSCVFIGCETDDECRYLVPNPAQAGGNVTAVCR
jgi:hypothetical protein